MDMENRYDEACNQVDNMTIAQVRALKLQYRTELTELLRKFFEDRPTLGSFKIKQSTGLSDIRVNISLGEVDSDKFKPEIFIIGDTTDV